MVNAPLKTRLYNLVDDSPTINTEASPCWLSLSLSLPLQRFTFYTPNPSKPFNPQNLSIYTQEFTANENNRYSHSRAHSLFIDFPHSRTVYFSIIVIDSAIAVSVIGLMLFFRSKIRIFLVNNWFDGGRGRCSRHARCFSSDGVFSGYPQRVARCFWALGPKHWQWGAYLN